ncbi:hypothetical protein, partial [Nocardiopsis rhodophaea]|uniref:hypothetical protein n=1 Tax=Nocardiopsis rhodophaea TaxID=280238 RepID=UPI0039EF2255
MRGWRWRASGSGALAVLILLAAACGSHDAQVVSGTLAPVPASPSPSLSPMRHPNVSAPPHPQ